MEQLVIPNVYAWAFSPTFDSLLCQTRWKPQSDPENSGLMEIPGGKWRAYESAWDCIAREVREECCCEFLRPPSLPDGSVHSTRVEALEPVLVVNIIDGPYPSALIVLPGIAIGQPAATGDGARDARFASRELLASMVASSPSEITPLTHHVLSLTLPRWDELANEARTHAV